MSRDESAAAQGRYYTPSATCSLCGRSMGRVCSVCGCKTAVWRGCPECGAETLPFARPFVTSEDITLNICEDCDVGD